HLLGDPDKTSEAFLLFPWDFAAELDWRSGVPSAPDAAAIIDRARANAERIRRRPLARLAYVPAPVPPVFADPDRTREIIATLGGIAAGLGAVEIPSTCFSLASYLGTGCPIGGSSLGLVATALVDVALQSRRESAKVLVTDLDNVMWRGVVADEG